jgi:hypothetical protein
VSEFVRVYQNWPTMVPSESVFTSVAFSAGVGIFFGFYPPEKPRRSIRSKPCGLNKTRSVRGPQSSVQGPSLSPASVQGPASVVGSRVLLPRPRTQDELRTPDGRWTQDGRWTLDSGPRTLIDSLHLRP